MLRDGFEVYKTSISPLPHPLRKSNVLIYSLQSLAELLGPCFQAIASRPLETSLEFPELAHLAATLFFSFAEVKDLIEALKLGRNGKHATEQYKI